MTPRPELLSLLAACKADPDDDARRLVLADALDEYGDEHDRARADFIRTMVREARWLAPSTEVRLRGLLRQHLDAWLGPIAPALPYPDRDLILYRKGLVRSVVLREQLLQTAGLASSEPWAWVEVAGAFLFNATEAQRMIHSGLLGTVSGLWLSQRLTAGLVRDLFADDVMGGLHSLDLSEAYLVENTLNAVLKSSPVANLRVLQIDSNKIPMVAQSKGLGSLRELLIRPSYNSDPQLINPLAGRQGLAGVRRLFVSGNPLGPGGVRGLLGGPAFQAMTQLALGSAGCQPEDALALATSPRLTGLTELVLSDNPILDLGAEALASSPNLRCLEVLDLRNNGLGQRGALAVAASPVLATVESLDLSDNSLGTEGCQALARAPMPALRRLSLNGCAVGPAGLKALAKGPWLANLRQLTLARNGITAAGLEEFLAGCASLESIDLQENRLGPAGAEVVAACRQMARLCELNIAGNGLGDSGMLSIARSPHLNRDIRLLIYGNGAPSAGTADALRERFSQQGDYDDAFVPDVE